MTHKPIAISVIVPLSLAGILTLAVLGWMSLTNQAFAQHPPPTTKPPFSSMKITLTGFPGQNGESVTNVGLRCLESSPGHVCVGTSKLVIPGIGEGSTEVRFNFTPSFSIHGGVIFSGLPHQRIPSFPVTVNGVTSSDPRLFIDGIGLGQALLQLS